MTRPVGPAVLVMRDVLGDEIGRHDWPHPTPIPERIVVPTTSATGAAYRLTFVRDARQLDDLGRHVYAEHVPEL